MIFSTVFIGFNKEKLGPHLQTNNQQNFIPTAQDANYNTLIKSYAIGLINLANNSNFRQKVKDGADEYFDDDHNVLFYKLNSSVSSLGINLKDSIRASILQNESSILIPPSTSLLYPNISVSSDPVFLAQGVSGMPYYEDTLFLQIFIPEVCPQNNSLRPTIVMVYEDEAVTDGIRYNGVNWEYVQVDSTYAKNNLCWAISTNESGIRAYNLVSYFNNNNNNSLTDLDNPIETRGECSKLIRFNQIYVTDVKENIWAGKGDLQVIVQRVLANCSRPEGAPQWFFTQKIKCCTWCNVDFKQGNLFFKNTSIGRGRALERPESAGWILYEKDNRKKYDQCKIIEQCQDQGYTFRSRQSEFGIEWYFGWDYCFPNTNWTDFTYTYEDGCQASFSIRQRNQ